MAANDERTTERIEMAARYFEREEYALAERFQEARSVLYAVFTTALLGSTTFMPNPGQAGTIVVLFIPPAVWLFNRWKRRELRKVDEHIWIFWCNGLKREQIEMVRKRVDEIRAARHSIRHRSATTPLTHFPDNLPAMLADQEQSVG